MNNNRERKPLAHSPLGWALGISIFIVSILGSANLAIMLVDREPPITYIEREALQLDVPQGGVLTITYTVERNRICASSINRWIVDSEHVRHIVAAYTSNVSSNISLGRISDTREVTVPVAVAVGPAVQYIESMYYCNALQRLFDWPIIVRSPDVRFNVVKGNVPQSSQLEGLKMFDQRDIQNVINLRYLMPSLNRRYADERIQK